MISHRWRPILPTRSYVLSILTSPVENLEIIHLPSLPLPPPPLPPIRHQKVVLCSKSYVCSPRSYTMAPFHTTPCTSPNRRMEKGVVNKEAWQGAEILAEENSQIIDTVQTRCLRVPSVQRSNPPTLVRLPLVQRNRRVTPSRVDPQRRTNHRRTLTCLHKRMPYWPQSFRKRGN